MNGRAGAAFGRRDGGKRHTRRWRPPWGGWAGAVAAVVLRPGLWATALRQGLALARPGWWRRWPPVPLPDPAYLRFRLQTAYGDAGRPPAPADVLAYLEWCRDFRRVRYPSR